jgi:perosamine synthetase
MDAINEIAVAHGLWVVEDAAEAPFAKYKGRVAGSLSRIATFSFYGNKIFTSGEGGAITLSDPELEQRARLLRGQGMDPDRRYFFPITGYNFRLTNLACALLCAQLERRADILERRKRIFELYRELLTGVAGILFQPIASWAERSPWLFCILIDQERFGISRDDLIVKLKTVQIDSRPFFIPLHRLPPFRDQSRARKDSLPVTDDVADRGLNLPTFTGLAESDLKRVVDAIRTVRR